MRHWMIGAALVAAPAAAQDETVWGFFEASEATGGVTQTAVQAPDGSQLILKCDKPGKKQVYGVMFTHEKLQAPALKAPFRPVTFRFDGGAPVKDNWRFFDQTVVAVHQTNDRTLVRFLEQLVNAKKVEVLLEPQERAPVTLNFDVTGAKEAIAKIYASCKDDNPVS